MSNAPRKSPPRRTGKCEESPPEALLEGIEEFNQQRFFEQHETLERIWIAETDSVRYLYQGILQVGVGFYHWRKGNWHGAVVKLRQGLEKLEPYRPACMTVDVERLVRETVPLLQELQRRGREDLAPFAISALPKVHRVMGSV